MKYKIVYQKGKDRCVTYMEVDEGISVLYAFYMKYGYGVDVIEISEANE